MKSTYKVILSRDDTVGGKQVQHDKVRDCRATLAMTRGEQSGRSMVEMLGVLAVIGLLSVAGIAGYSIAMRSYRTNEIVNAASMLHILAMAQNAGNGPNTNVGYTDVGGNANPSGVSALEYNKDTKAISITFTDPDDCTMAANKLGDKATADCANKKITVNFGESSTNTTILENITDNFLWEDPGTYEEPKSCNPSTFTECFVADGTYEGHMYGKLTCNDGETEYNEECCDSYTDEQAAQHFNLPPCNTVL